MEYTEEDMAAPVEHFEYPATTAIRDPAELQAWLDAHAVGKDVVATEKIDGSNTVFLVGPGGEGAAHVVVALFSRSSVVYVAHVYPEAEGHPAAVQVVFQADLKRF